MLREISRSSPAHIHWKKVRKVCIIACIYGAYILVVVVVVVEEVVIVVMHVCMYVGVQVYDISRLYQAVENG